MNRFLQTLKASLFLGADIGEFRGIDLNVTVNNPSLFCAPEIQAVTDSLRTPKD